METIPIPASSFFSACPIWSKRLPRSGSWAVRPANRLMSPDSAVFLLAATRKEFVSACIGGDVFEHARVRPPLSFSRIRAVLFVVGCVGARTHRRDHR